MTAPDFTDDEPLLITIPGLEKVNRTASDVAVSASGNVRRVDFAAKNARPWRFFRRTARFLRDMARTLAALYRTH